jgi:hypothetical protein
MEASNGAVRGVIESLTRVMAALEVAGVEFINDGGTSLGGGSRGKHRAAAHEPEKTEI